MKNDDIGRRAGREPRAPRDVLVDAVPTSDPASGIVREILRVVPASRWAFAHVESDGDVDRLLASDHHAGELSRLQGEFARQRVNVATGPRIAAALGPLGDFESGITLLFADARATFGILTLMRTTALGPFTSSELSMLAFAVAAASDQLSALRLHPLERDADPEPVRTTNALPVEPQEEAYYVLDQDMQIVLAWSTEEQRRIAVTGLRTRVADHLPKVLEETVRELTSAWDIEPFAKSPGVARPVPFLVVRTQPMSGPTGLFIGVRIERFRSPNSLTDAATRYHITPRELQVLGLLLDGAQLEDIGKRLHITPSTVQDHIRNMVEKTASRNRSELIARVLGWECTPVLETGA